MDPFAARVRDLLKGRRTAALATLQAGAPAASLVPFALLPGTALIHISAMAAHTRDLAADPRCALLVSASEDGAEDLRALPRVSLRATARTLDPDDPAYPAARAAYLARFPGSEGIFALGDFHLVALDLEEARAVLGFGAARTLDRAALVALTGPA